MRHLRTAPLAAPRGADQVEGQPDRIGAVTDHLRTIFEHHIWATLRLLDHCLDLKPAQLALSTPGTYGTIQETLTHLVGADARYQHRIMTGQPKPRHEGAPPSLAELRADMAEQGDRWRDLLGRLDEFDVSLPAEPDETPPYPAIRHAVGLIVTQAIHHGEEHRVQVNSILGAHGVEVPELSGWEYFRQLVLGGA